MIGGDVAPFSLSFFFCSGLAGKVLGAAHVVVQLGIHQQFCGLEVHFCRCDGHCTVLCGRRRWSLVGGGGRRQCPAVVGGGRRW